MLDQPTARELPPRAETSQAYTRARIRFRKDGDLRFLGHHDLMHCFERMFRRANLPVLSTHGFNPRPRLTFALSLALGLVGKREILDAELDGLLSASEIRDRLEAQAPAGLEIIDLCLLGPREKAHVHAAIYRIELPMDRAVVLSPRIESLLASSTCWVERQRPRPRRCDIKPFLLDMRLIDSSLEMVIAVTPDGTARPEEVLRLLDLGDLLDAGAIIERADLLLDGDRALGPDSSHSTHAGSVQQEISTHNTVTGCSSKDSTRPGSSAAEEPPHRPTSLLPGPLSFDT